MVRILQYDPQISAEAYSRRRAAEQPFESPVAAGLGQLGRALTEREERRAPGHQDKTKAMKVLGRMRKEEFARLKEQDIFSDLRERWSAKGHVLEYVSRRDETIAELAKKNPRAAQIVAEKSAILTEDLSRRAMVMESNNAGQALVADINAAVGDAIETVRTDPSQLGAVLSEFRGTMTELSEDGMDSDATATIIGAAEGKIANAAFRQRLKEDPEAAKEELEAGEFGDALRPEQAEALLTKADQAVKVRQRQSEAAARSGEDQFVSELRAYEQRLLDGEAPDDETFSDEAIMARVSPEVADGLIRGRDRAEARGRAFAEIQFMSEAEIKERLGEAERDEVRHLLWARGHRRELMKQGPAAFALRDPVVREAHERWLQARADGDAAAAGHAGLAYSNAALALQRRMGLSASEQGVLTADVAAELVRQSEMPDGPDAAALGTMLRDQLGEHWRVALADLERAGLSEQVAIIAGLDGAGQQPAARQLAAMVGTRTSDLRESAGDAAAAIDHLLGITIGGVQGGQGDHAIGADTSRGELVRRRAYALAAEGWAPNRAVQRAIEDLSASNSSQAGGSEELPFETLAESQGIHPSALGSGGAAVRSILERFTRFYDLSDNEQDVLKDDIRRLNGEHEGYSVLRDRFVDLENAFGFFASDSDPEVIEQIPLSVLEFNYMQLVDRNGLDDAISRSNLFSGLGPGLLMSERVGKENRAWINNALTGEDTDRRDFAADYLAHIGRKTGFDIGEVLSENGRDRYFASALERYEAQGRSDPGPRLPSDIWLEQLAQAAATEGSLGIPQELAATILVDISRMAGDEAEGREALIQYIARVVTPFDRVAGLRMQEAVMATSVEVGEIPARYASLLSDEQLLDAALARGMNALRYEFKPVRPPGLEGLDHLIGAGGVAVSAVGAATAVAGVATAPISGSALLGAAILGLVGSALGYRNAIDDENDEHTKYLIHMEIYRRHQNPETHQGIFDTQLAIRRRFQQGDSTDGEVEKEVDEPEGFSLIQQ